MNDTEKEEQNKEYLESYLKLEEAYAMLRNKCQNCIYYPDGPRPSMCDKCFVPKVEYYIEMAIKIVKLDVGKSIVELDKDYVLERIYKIYNREARESYFDYIALDRLLTEATLSCGDCHGCNCMGCDVENQMCQTGAARDLIKDDMDEQIKEKFDYYMSKSEEYWNKHCDKLNIFERERIRNIYYYHKNGPKIIDFHLMRKMVEIFEKLERVKA